MRYCLGLHRGIDDYAGKLLGLDQLEINGYLDGLRQQLPAHGHTLLHIHDQ